MKATELFLTGWSLHLAANGVGTWRPDDTPYLADEIAIIHGSVPAEPDQVITLTAYGVTDDPSLSDTTLGLQVKTRGARQSIHSAGNISDDIFQLLHAAHDFRLPAPAPLTAADGVWVVQCLRRSAVTGGKDDNQRWSYIQNFYVDVHQPSTNRT